MEAESVRAEEIDLTTYHGPFVAALMAGLRERGLRVGLSETLACASLLRIQPKWSHADLHSILSAVTVRRSTDLPIFHEALRELLEQRPPDNKEQTQILAPSLASTVSPESLLQTWGQRLRTVLNTIYEIVERLLKWGSSRSSRTIKRFISDFRFWVILLVLVLAATLHFAPALPNHGRYVTRTSMENAVPWSLGLVLLGLCAWRSFMTRSANAESERQVGLPPKQLSREKPADDGSVFRIGSLGGNPPSFLSPALAQEIAELFAYRVSESTDPRRLDIRRTIAEQTRGGDPSVIHFHSQRQLPTVLLLVDSSSDALFWNTLPSEFAATLTKWGVQFEKIEYSRSLFTVGQRPRRERPEVQLIDSIVTSPGWTVTTVFAEARRLSRPDIQLMRCIADNGPLLFFELSNPGNWEPHRASYELGISIGPATARYLRDSLARLFAPDRAQFNSGQVNNRSELWEFQAVGTRDYFDLEIFRWAGCCALVQPTSLGLAEQLRSLRPGLANADASLSFSALTALPGAWIGPEGLSFDAPTRRGLLRTFSELPEEQRSAVISAIQRAIEAAPANGTTAEHVRSYLRAQVNLFGPVPGDALDEIEEVAAAGVIDRQPLDYLIERIEPILYSEAVPKGRQPEKILIPHEPRRAEQRLRFSQDKMTYVANNHKIAPASWNIAVPEIRLRITEMREQSTFAAAFLPGADEIVIDNSSGRSASLLLVHAANARSFPIQLDTPGYIEALVASREARSVAVLTSSNAVFVVRGLNIDSAPESVSVVTIHLDASKQEMMSGNVVFDVNPSGAVLVLSGSRLTQLRFFETEHGSPIDSEIEFNQAIALLRFAADSLLIAILQNGEVVKVVLSDAHKVQSYQTIASIGAHPSSAAVINMTSTHTTLLVGLSDGRVVALTTSNDISNPAVSTVELGQLAMPARTIVPCSPSADYGAVQVQSGTTTDLNQRAAMLDAGQCVTIQMADNSLDIYGLPLGAAGEMLLAGDLPLFSPMSLVHRRIGPALDGSSIISIAANGRKVVSKRLSRLEIRPLVYDPPHHDLARMTAYPSLKTA